MIGVSFDLKVGYCQLVFKKIKGSRKGEPLSILAEGEGFEPSIRITVCRLSRAVHSTTLPPFQVTCRKPEIILLLVRKSRNF